MARMADILIVGGGVIGCAIAYELAKAGLAVTLVERGTPGCEASSAGAGMLAPQAESSAASPRLGLGLASKALYADLALELRERTGLDIEYETGGNLHCFLDEGDEAVGRAACAWQREAGLKAELLSRADGSPWNRTFPPRFAARYSSPRTTGSTTHGSSRLWPARRPWKASALSPERRPRS